MADVALPAIPGGSGYIHFKNGVRALVNASKGQASDFCLEIIGEEGRLDVENTVTLSTGAGRSELLDLPPHMIIGIPAYIEELIGVIEDGGELLSPASEGKKVVEIIIGFLKSQERGNVRVDLPLPPGKLIPYPTVTPLDDLS